MNNKWTARIVECTKDALVFHFVVEFLKNGEVIDKINFKDQGNPGAVSGTIQSQLNQYEKIDALDTDSLVGPYVPLPEDTIDQDRKTFRDLYVKYIQLKKAVAAGLGKEDQAYLDLEALIKSTYKDEYANIIKELGN